MHNITVVTYEDSFVCFAKGYLGSYLVRDFSINSLKDLVERSDKSRDVACCVRKKTEELRRFTRLLSCIPVLP